MTMDGVPQQVCTSDECTAAAETQCHRCWAGVCLDCVAEACKDKYVLLVMFPAVYNRRRREHGEYGTMTGVICMTCYSDALDELSRRAQPTDILPQPHAVEVPLDPGCR